MIRYYKLFDLLNRRDMKKSDLRKILSSKTVAKLSKGENITTDVIDKICIFLKCQPSDIMEVIEIEETNDPKIKLIEKSYIVNEENDITAKDTSAIINDKEILIQTDNPLIP